MEKFKYKKSANKNEWFGNFYGIDWDLSGCNFDGKIWYYPRIMNYSLMPTTDKKWALATIESEIFVNHDLMKSGDFFKTHIEI